MVIAGYDGCLLNVRITRDGLIIPSRVAYVYVPASYTTLLPLARLVNQVNANESCCRC